MGIHFTGLVPGREYGRPQLAELWGYQDWHAIGRGIIAPPGQGTIVLFITEEKQAANTQYEDSYDGKTLRMEGETNHQHDNRLIQSMSNGDVIHLFYRKRHHCPFVYCGRALINDYQMLSDRPSRFTVETTQRVLI